MGLRRLPKKSAQTLPADAYTPVYMTFCYIVGGVISPLLANLYLHPLEWYLSLRSRRDVIEYPIQDDLDLHGWDLRKALLLLRKRRLKFRGERVDEEAGRVMDLAVPRKPEDEEFTLEAIVAPGGDPAAVVARLKRLLGAGARVTAPSTVPAMRCSSVVFPLPLGPITATVVPCSIRSRSCRCRFLTATGTSSTAW